MTELGRIGGASASREPEPSHPRTIHTQRETAQDGDNQIVSIDERIPSRSLDSLPASEVHPKYAVISLSRRRRRVHSDSKD